MRESVLIILLMLAGFVVMWFAIVRDIITLYVLLFSFPAVEIVPNVGSRTITFRAVILFLGLINRVVVLHNRFSLKGKNHTSN